MKEYFEGFYLTDDKNEILQRLDEVENLLKQTYWAQNRKRELIQRSIENSVCYGIVDVNKGNLAAFARVITDYATLYCLEDVIVDEGYRGRGLGKKMIAYITECEEKLKGSLASP